MCVLRRRWSIAEHKRFVEGLQKFGRRKWIRIAQHVGTRTVIQVRSHAQKYFKKLRKEEMICEEPRQVVPHLTHPSAALGPSQFALSFAPMPASWHPAVAPPGKPPASRPPEDLAEAPEHRRRPPDDDVPGGLALLTAAANILDKHRRAGAEDPAPSSDSYQVVLPYGLSPVTVPQDYASALAQPGRTRPLEASTAAFDNRQAARPRLSTEAGLVF